MGVVFINVAFFDGTHHDYIARMKLLSSENTLTFIFAI